MATPGASKKKCLSKMFINIWRGQHTYMATPGASKKRCWQYSVILILPAVKEVIKTVLHKSPEQVIKSIPLSDNSVQRRVDKMTENVEETLNKMLMTTEFSLQLVESTLPGNESLLLAYVRFIKGGSLCQELLFARLLETDTKGEFLSYLIYWISKLFDLLDF